tara:strand:- start:41 stop:1273 length:1233 start_codon:yes stop_codon:yes gene_type:complete
MGQYTLHDLENTVKQEFRKLEDKICRAAEKMLQEAFDLEVEEYLGQSKDHIDSEGRRVVVRNGYLPTRDLVTPVGKVRIQQPRVKDARAGKQFQSQLLSPYQRRTTCLDSWIPELYLKGVSTNAMPDVFRRLLGCDVSGLSAANIARLRSHWQSEYSSWLQRDLSEKRYVYVWADGIHLKVRLVPEKPCVLVVIGATAEGKKELIALDDGERESKASWKDLLLDLKERGLKTPRLAIADGGKGFWSALPEVFPETETQRCWVHKLANVLNRISKRHQPKAKAMLHQIYKASTQRQALAAYNRFLNAYENLYPKACDILKKDFDQLFTFYSYPAKHWQHIRSTNVVESTFATVRLRTRQTKGCLGRKATLAMVYKLTMEAQKRWHSLHSHKLITLVDQGVTFKDGKQKKAA